MALWKYFLSFIPPSASDDGVKVVKWGGFVSSRRTYPVIGRGLTEQLGESAKILSSRCQDKFVVGTGQSA